MLDGEVVMSVTVWHSPSRNGFVAIGPANFGIAHFDNLHIISADRNLLDNPVKYDRRHRRKLHYERRNYL